MNKIRTTVQALARLIYREDFYSFDEFTALRLTETGAPPAARRMRILPMKQRMPDGR
jgi:hypothetical protein